ncbi:MAG: hypothetical protein IMZ61_14665 [Planctomycetes bacterium]|nr:hypothetical protein [Planctomycetota bacterium]
MTDEERETAAQDQGYRIQRNGLEKHRPLFQKQNEMPTSCDFEELSDLGLVRIEFLRGYKAGHTSIVNEALAEDRIKHRWAVRSENQTRVIQT